MNAAEYFDEKAPHWDDGYEPDVPVRKAVAFLAGAGGGKRMLDIACGTGVMFPELLDQGTEALVGVDISPIMAGIAQKNSPGNPKSEWNVRTCWVGRTPPLMLRCCTTAIPISHRGFPC